MKKGMPTISIMPSMCSALKKMDISSNEGIKYCTFRNEGIKMSKKKERSCQIHLGTRDVDEERFHRRE